jgi:predicted HAD superfamily hydrolase
MLIEGVKIIEDYPPKEIYDRCVKKFGVDFNKGIIFTVGNNIYVRNRKMVTPDLLEHELTHVKQQAHIGVGEWWDKYLKDPQFRLEQETEAYRNQYRYAKQNYNRGACRMILALTSRFLSGSMYGELITKEKAKELIEQ